MIREIDPDDFIARGQVQRGTQPEHCGRPARYEDSGIWECASCGSFGQSDRPGGLVRTWTKPKYSPIDYGRN